MFPFLKVPARPFDPYREVITHALTKGRRKVRGEVQNNVGNVHVAAVVGRGIQKGKERRE